MLFFIFHKNFVFVIILNLWNYGIQESHYIAMALIMRLDKMKRFIIISILILLAGIAIPYFSYWGIEKWQDLLLILGLALGSLIFVLIYFKNPVILLFLVPPVIIFGQVATLKIRDWYYEISLAEILLLALFALFVLQKIARKDFRGIKFPLLLAILLLYLFFSFLSQGWAQNLSRAAIALRILCFHFLAFFLVINLIKKERDFKLALWALPLTGLAVAGQLIFKVSLLGGFMENYVLARETIITPVGKWVYIAAIIILTIPLSYALLLAARKNLVKVALLGIIILSLSAVALTLGKGEIIAVAAGLLYFFKRQERKKYLAAIIILAMLFVTFFPLASYGKKFLERFTHTFSDPNTNFRLTEFKVATKLFLKHPFLGVGSGNLKLEYKNLLPWSSETESNNLFLQITLELGLIGLAIVILIIRQIYLELKRMKNLSLRCEEKIIYLGFVGTMIVVLVNSLLEVTLIGLYYGIIFWYIMGLLLAQNNLLKQKND